MLETPYQTFEHRFFYSMINRDDPQVIPNYFATNIENWLIRNAGELEMRDGLTARGASPSATNLGSAVLYRANGVKKFVRVINGAGNTSKFQASDDGATWVDISGGDSRTTDRTWVFVQANNNLYGVNGTDTPVKYDGSSITTISAIPNGTAIEWYKNFLWVIGVQASPDVLYFSNANNPESFGGSDLINVNLGDASPGTALKGSPGGDGRLYVGKARSVWYVTGTSSANFAIQPLTYEHGVAGAEAIVAGRNDVWCVDQDCNIRALYRTVEDNPFSTLKSSPIQATISGLNKTAVSKVTTVYYNNYVMFFVPNGVDDYNSLVLVWDTQANQGKGGWITFTGWRIARATVFVLSTPRLFLHDARTGNGQTYEWTGTSDNGTAITAKYETKIYDHGFPEREKKWKFAYQFAPSLSGASVRFYASIDRFYYTLLKTISLAGMGDSLWGVAQWGVDTWGSQRAIRQRVSYSESGGDNTGYTQQIKIEAESSTQKIRVRQFTSHYLVKGLH